MQPHVYLTPFFFGVASVIASPIHAAQTVPLQSLSFKSLQQTFSLALSAKKLQASPAKIDSLEFITQHTDNKHITHVRMQQHYAGFPVFGGYAIIHTQDTGTLFVSSSQPSLSGTVYTKLEEDVGQPTQQFIEQANLALQQFKTHYSSQFIREEHVTPMVYIDGQHRAWWAYKVSVLVQSVNNIPERPTAIIDAQTFKPFEQWNDVKTSRHVVKGQGYGGNPRAGMHQYGVDLPFLKITRDSETKMCYMKNKDVRVMDMNKGYVTPSSPMAIRCESDPAGIETSWWTGYLGDGYDQQNGAYSPTNDALYIGTVIKDMYTHWYNIDALTKHDKSMPLVMRVHYGKGYENAFWDGKQMTFGDGDNMMYPLVSLGVGAHEISHGFTEQHSDLNYFGQSGGMNESFSDMAAQAAEFYTGKVNSWDIGHDIMKENSGYNVLRYMDKPSRDGRSIDKADQYRKGMNVHYSSGVYNRLFYLLATQPGWDVRQAFHVMLKANVDYWTPYSTFEEGACGVLNAARDLDLPLDAVKQSLDGVLIDYTECMKT